MADKPTYEELVKRGRDLEKEIIKLKRSDKLLRESEEALRLQSEITTHMAEGVNLVKASDTVIVYANPKFEEMFGYDHGELIGKHVSVLNAPTEKNPEETAKEIEESLQKHGIWEGEICNIKKDGTLFWCFARVSSFDHSEYGQVLISVHSDITDRKQAEEEKDRLQDQLRQTHKMEAIGTLAGGIAHEFNNILGVIIGNTELALMDVPDWNPAKECLKETRKASLRAKDVVLRIMSFARKTPLERKPIQIGTIIKESLKLIRATTPTIIEIRQAILCESEMILAQPTEISQVFMNLCTNSAHAMGEGGGVLEVGLKAISLDDDTAAQYEDLKPGDYAELTVRDTGHGIRPEVIDRIFDPYFTTKDVDEGLGMGLAVVYGIVKKHDGAIKVKSEVDKGTEVEVLFPIIKEEVEGEVEKPQVLPGGTGCILFVDDEESLVKMAEQMLKRLGYKVVTKTNPKEALALFKAEPHRFELVITDMSMPHLTGDKLARELMKIRQDIPIILCTGHSAYIDEVKAMGLGIKAYAMKPLVMENLANIVRKVLDHK